MGTASGFRPRGEAVQEVGFNGCSPLEVGTPSQREARARHEQLWVAPSGAGGVKIGGIFMNQLCSGCSYLREGSCSRNIGCMFTTAMLRLAKLLGEVPSNLSFSVGGLL